MFHLSLISNFVSTFLGAVPLGKLRNRKKLLKVLKIYTLVPVVMMLWNLYFGLDLCCCWFLDIKSEKFISKCRVWKVASTTKGVDTQGQISNIIKYYCGQISNIIKYYHQQESKHLKDRSGLSTRIVRQSVRQMTDELSDCRSVRNFWLRFISQP